MRILPLCLALLAFPAAAEIYSYVDTQGNRVFTDQPQDGAPALRLSPTNRMSFPPAPPPAAEKPAPRAKKPGYRWLRIVDPAPDATLRDSGALTVTAASEPGLHPGHSYRLQLDGAATGPGGLQPVFSLNDLERGTHLLAVEILDAEGRTLEQTPEQAIHVKRPSLIQKRLARPCKIADYGVRPECLLKDRPPQRRDIPYVPFL